MKKLISLLLIFCLIFAAAACTAQDSPSPSPATDAPATDSAAPSTDDASPVSDSEFDKLDKIYIGCYLPLTGAGALTGKFCQDASELWLEKTNAEGGILGKQVEIVYEDTQHTETGAANAYHKLASRGDISAIYGGQYSNQGLATLPFVKQYEIPSIVHGSSVRFAEAVPDNPYSYQNRINDVGTGASLADAIVNVLKAEKIAVIHDTNAFGQGLADNTIKFMKEYGVEPAIVLSFTTNEKQFAGFLSQAKEAGVDGIVMIAHPNEAALIQMGMADAGLSDIIKLGSPDAAASTTISLSGDAANDWYSIADWVPTIETEPGKSFAAEYRETYGIEADMNSSSAYDILTILKAAIEKAGSQDPAAIQEAMQDLGEVQGVATLYSFNEQQIGATTQNLAYTENQTPVIKNVITRADFKK
ncbi:MAG: ABC transporter substrate-binding protein [Christensenellales bacterium]|jgi:branched-chain amino acid transport system substrate-binding protein